MLELFRSPRRVILWVVETSLLAMLVFCVSGLMVGWRQTLQDDYITRAVLISSVAQGSIYYHGLYGSGTMPWRGLILGFMRALGVAAVVLFAVFHLVEEVHVAPSLLIATLGGATIVLPVWRACYHGVASRDRFRRPALLLGGGTLARACADVILRDDDLGVRLCGVLLQHGEEPPGGGIEVLGRYDDLARVCASQRVRLIIVASSDRRGTLPVEQLLELKFGGVDIEEAVDVYERVTGKIYVRELKPSHLIFSPGFHVRRRTLVAKRALDVLGAAIGLVLALPLMIAAAIAIRVDSPGAVVYSQVRSGAFGRLFWIHKFRSMRTDAEVGGAAWAAENDPRVTRVGRFLRKTRIDELPQLWNVLIGDMSLVGPRPERPVFIAQLERDVPFFRQRLCVKPGVTGHAQVRCRYGASTEDALEKLQYDLFYIKSFSLWFDLSILIDTVKVVLLRIGAR